MATTEKKKILNRHKTAPFRVWTPEQRERQAEHCKTVKPWSNRKSGGVYGIRHGLRSKDPFIQAIGRFNIIVLEALEALEKMEQGVNENRDYRYLLQETDFCDKVKELRDELKDA
jgi:hypothetical protein